MNIAFDIGNSAIKAFDGSKTEKFAYDDAQWQEKLLSFVRLHSGVLERVAISAVVNEHKETLQAMLHTAAPQCAIFSFGELLEQQREVDFSQVRGMGDDRKAGLIGAIASGTTPCITIDCGTACTINVLSPEKICLGGAILPGCTTQMRALNHFTDALPLIELATGEDCPIGKNTAEAINTGIVAGVQGGILHIVQEWQKRYFGGNKVRLIVTGGGAHFVLNFLKQHSPHVEHNPTLLLQGILHLLSQSRSGESPNRT